MTEDDYLHSVATGKPDTPLSGKQWRISIHKEVIKKCWLDSVFYGGEPTDYLTPELLAKYPCPITEMPIDIETPDK